MSDYIDPADVKVGQRVQLENRRKPIVGYWENVVYTSPEGTVDIIRDGGFHVTYPGGGDASAWYRQDDPCLRVRLIEDTKPDLAPGIYSVAVQKRPQIRCYLRWDGGRWVDANGDDWTDYGWVDPRPVLLDSQIAVDRPRDGFGADLDAPTIRHLAADLRAKGRTASPAVLDSVADALEREERRS